jgi:hypothetical protein
LIDNIKNKVNFIIIPFMNININRVEKVGERGDTKSGEGGREEGRERDICRNCFSIF